MWRYATWSQKDDPHHFEAASPASVGSAAAGAGLGGLGWAGDCSIDFVSAVLACGAALGSGLPGDDVGWPLSFPGIWGTSAPVTVGGSSSLVTPNTNSSNAHFVSNCSLDITGNASIAPSSTSKMKGCSVRPPTE